MSDTDPALAALQRGDHEPAAKLYFDRAASVESPEASCFYATHAYVHALCAGDTTLADKAQKLLREAGKLR